MHKNVTFKTLCWNRLQGSHIRDVYTFSVIFDPPLSPLVHTCPHLADPIPSLCPCRHKIWIWYGNNPNSNNQLHHNSPYTNTNKVSRKVKYLLTTLTQKENREIINIYLKISYGNRKKYYLFYETYILPCMNTLKYSPDSNKCGVPSVG